jgi:hypothetical protein
MSILEYIRQEIAVIRAAPVSCLFVAAIGFGIGGLWYGERTEMLRLQNETLRGDKEYNSIYANLSNDDLKAKTTHMVGKLRDLEFEYQRRDGDAKAQFFAGKMAADKRKELREVYDQEATEEFVKDFRSEAVILNIELRHRLSSQATAGIVKSGPVLAPNSFVNVIPGELMGMVGIEMGANELEQLNAKLPPDRHRWWIWPTILIGISFLVLFIFWAIHSGVRIVEIRDSQSPPPSQA